MVNLFEIFQCISLYRNFLEVLSAIFLNIIKSDEESIRIRLLKFINEYLPTIPTSLMNSELKDEVENYFRKVVLIVYLLLIL